MEGNIFSKVKVSPLSVHRKPYLCFTLHGITPFISHTSSCLLPVHTVWTVYDCSLPSVSHKIWSRITTFSVIRSGSYYMAPSTIFSSEPTLCPTFPLYSSLDRLPYVIRPGDSVQFLWWKLRVRRHSITLNVIPSSCKDKRKSLLSKPILTSHLVSPYSVT